MSKLIIPHRRLTNDIVLYKATIKRFSPLDREAGISITVGTSYGETEKVLSRVEFDELQERYEVTDSRDLFGKDIIAAYRNKDIIGLMPIKSDQF